jgi:hypothetical protein
MALRPLELQLQRQTGLLELMERKLLKLECLLKMQMQDPEDACKQYINLVFVQLRIAVSLTVAEMVLGRASMPHKSLAV